MLLKLFYIVDVFILWTEILVHEQKHCEKKWSNCGIFYIYRFDEERQAEVWERERAIKSKEAG